MINTHECRPANPSVVHCLSTQQVQPREYRALHWRQSEHPATIHPAGADDRRRHEELPETEQATSCTSELHLSVCVYEVYMCSCGTLNWAVLHPGPDLLSHHAGAATDGQRHRLWLSLPGREPLHTQVQIHSQLLLLRAQFEYTE